MREREPGKREEGRGGKRRRSRGEEGREGKTRQRFFGKKAVFGKRISKTVNYHLSRPIQFQSPFWKRLLFGSTHLQVHHPLPH